MFQAHLENTTCEDFQTFSPFPDFLRPPLGTHTHTHIHTSSHGSLAKLSMPFQRFRSMLPVPCTGYYASQSQTQAFAILNMYHSHFLGHLNGSAPKRRVVTLQELATQNLTQQLMEDERETKNCVPSAYPSVPTTTCPPLQTQQKYLFA